MYIAEKLLVQPDPGLYHFINQGVLDVDGMDDKEEMQTADVCVIVFVLVFLLPLPFHRI